VCLAIELAHRRGVIHRDLKPANLMLGDFGEAYVLDWGLARVSEDKDAIRASDLPSDPGQTVAGAMLGTPGYMAPEQYTSDLVDERTDQFAFCVALYAALYGEKPFPGKSLNEVVEATLLGEVRDAPKGTAVGAKATAAPPRIRLRNSLLVAGLARSG